MAKVLTWDEYTKTAQSPVETPIQNIGAQLPVYRPDEPAEAPPVIKYHKLMYPDNSAGSYHNGKFHCEGVTLDIVNGTVWTDSNTVCASLMKQGFILMRSTTEKPEDYDGSSS